MARLSLPVQCQTNTAGVNAVIVYGDETFPMSPNPPPGVAESAVGRWSPIALWMVMAAVGVLILLVARLVLNGIL